MGEIMEITKLTKEAMVLVDKCRITVEITVDRPKSYIGLDVFPDEMIPVLLIGTGLKYKRRIKKGKLK